MVWRADGEFKPKRRRRTSTEVVVCACHVSGSTALRGALAQRYGGRAGVVQHPPRDLSFPVVQQRHSIAASADWSHVSSSRDGTATVVLREPQGGLAFARFGGGKVSPFSAIARLIRPSHRPCRSGEIQWRRGAARSYQFQMQSTDSART
jgi:hypothetical protein